MTDKTIATTILNQLGGNKFIAMTGAKHFDIMRRGIGFSIPRHNKVKYIRIYLNGLDTYDIEFLNTKLDLIVKRFNIYNDQLKQVFTDQTGLYTYL